MMSSDAFKFESQRRFLDINDGAMVVPLTARAEMDEVASWGAFSILRTDLTRPRVESAMSAWLGSTPASTTIDAWPDQIARLRGVVAFDVKFLHVRVPPERAR